MNKQCYQTEHFCVFLIASTSHHTIQSGMLLLLPLLLNFHISRDIYLFTQNLPTHFRVFFI